MHSYIQGLEGKMWTILSLSIKGLCIIVNILTYANSYHKTGEGVRKLL